MNTYEDRDGIASAVNEDKWAAISLQSLNSGSDDFAIFIFAPNDAKNAFLLSRRANASQPGWSRQLSVEHSLATRLYKHSRLRNVEFRRVDSVREATEAITGIMDNARKTNEKANIKHLVIAGHGTTFGLNFDPQNGLALKHWDGEPSAETSYFVDDIKEFFAPGSSLLLESCLTGAFSERLTDARTTLQRWFATKLPGVTVWAPDFSLTHVVVGDYVNFRADGFIATLKPTANEELVSHFHPLPLDSNEDD